MSAAAETSATLRLEGLSVARGGRPVVRDVSIEIPPAQVTTLLGAKRRRQVDDGARGRRHPAPERRPGDARRSRPDAPPARAGARGRCRGRPEGRRLLPALTVEDNLRVATYALSSARREERDRIRARALPRAREALARDRRACSRAASSRWSCSRRRSSRGRARCSSTSSHSVLRRSSSSVSCRRSSPSPKTASACS